MALPAHTHYTAAPPVDIHCTAALTLCQRTSTTPPHGHHNPHTICDQVTYTAWQSNHETHKDMHSATQEDADFRGKWLTWHSTMAPQFAFITSDTNR